MERATAKTHATAQSWRLWFWYSSGAEGAPERPVYRLFNRKSLNKPERGRQFAETKQQLSELLGESLVRGERLSGEEPPRKRLPAPRLHQSASD